MCRSTAPHLRSPRPSEERLIRINVVAPTQGACSVRKKVPKEDPDQAEEAQAALRDGLERARELVCEAKLAIRQNAVEAQPSGPPDPA